MHVSTVVFRDLFGVEELSCPLQREQVSQRRNEERLNCAASCALRVCQFQLFAYHYSMHASNHRVVKFFRKLFVFFFRDRQNDCIGTPRTKSDFTCHMLRDGLWLVGRRRGTLRCVCASAVRLKFQCVAVRLVFFISVRCRRVCTIDEHGCTRAHTPSISHDCHGKAAREQPTTTEKLEEHTIDVCSQKSYSVSVHTFAKI